MQGVFLLARLLDYRCGHPGVSPGGLELLLAVSLPEAECNPRAHLGIINYTKHHSYILLFSFFLFFYFPEQSISLLFKFCTVSIRFLLF